MDDLISRQAAINAVEFGITYAKAIDVNTGESKELFKEGNDALKKASERIKDLPSAQAETHEKRTETHACDLIERQAAIEVLEERLQANGYSNVALVSEFNRSIGYLMRLPSAQPQRKRGKWIYGEDNPGTGRDGWFCSKCGHFELWDYSADMKSAELNLPNYCPNCGADMRGEQDG